MDVTRVALVTAADTPDDDDGALLDALIWRGVEVALVAWTDRSVDWSGFALVVLRSAHDHAARAAEFLRWLRRVERRAQLATAPDLVEWNLDARYLRDLAGRVPVVPTTWLEPGDLVRIPDRGEIVVQPVLTTGPDEVARYHLPDGAADARVKVDALLRGGRSVMVQPYLGAPDGRPRVSVVYIEGQLSHALRPGPAATAATTPAVPPAVVTPGAAERAVADRAIAAVLERGRLLTARVDLAAGFHDEPLVAAVDLVAPSLYLTAANGSVDRLADAIAARATG
jgi:hypothetical protein